MQQDKKYTFKIKPFQFGTLDYFRSDEFKNDQNFNAELYWEYIMDETERLKHLEDQPFKFNDEFRISKQRKLNLF